MLVRMPSSIVDRFEGRILGAGSASGVRIVVGDWDRSPLGAFTDVMLATASGRRILLAPSREVADYVATTYSFDEVRIGPVRIGLVGADRLRVDAGPLSATLRIGARTAIGRLLRILPRPIATDRRLAVVTDPIARRLLPGVRTRGSAGNGRREYYGAYDQHRVLDLDGAWEGTALGTLAPVLPAPDFGFSSTPPDPALTSVVTTVVRPG